MKICIVSDSHDRADALLVALRAARCGGAEPALHGGDIIGGPTSWIIGNLDAMQFRRGGLPDRVNRKRGWTLT